MYVTQGRIFATEIPVFRLVITPFGTNLLTQAFRFRDASWNQENGDYVFQDGTFELEGTTIPITWLGFNERRIVVQVQGNSEAACALYGLLSAVLEQMTASFQEIVPLVFNEETSCAVQLGFDWPALLSPALVDQVSRMVQEFSTDQTKKVLKGVSIRFTLAAEATDEKISQYGIALPDATIAIEPKANVPLSERMYFTYSPCDSGTHLQLVSELEASLLGGAKKGRLRQRASD